MDVLVSHKIKYLIFSNLVASKSCGNEFWGLKAHYVKTSLFKCTSSQCHCLDSGVRERKRCGRQQITAHWPSFSLFILCSDLFFFFYALPEVERYYAAHHQISFHLTALCSSSRPSSKALVVSFGGQDRSVPSDQVKFQKDVCFITHVVIKYRAPWAGDYNRCHLYLQYLLSIFIW